MDEDVVAGMCGLSCARCHRLFLAQLLVGNGSVATGVRRLDGARPSLRHCPRERESSATNGIGYLPDNLAAQLVHTDNSMDFAFNLACRVFMPARCSAAKLSPLLQVFRGIASPEALAIEADPAAADEGASSSSAWIVGCRAAAPAAFGLFAGNSAMAPAAFGLFAGNSAMAACREERGGNDSDPVSRQRHH